MTTIYDVARRSGVSPATVSRVLSGRRNVDPELSEKVRAAVAELGYRPNGVARNLRKSRTNLLAVVISDIENPFFTSLVRGLEDVAQTEGYHVVLCNSDEDPAKEAAYASAVLTEQMAGVVISPTSTADGVLQLADAKLPMVLIDRRVDGVEADTVLVDNEHGAHEGVKHLIDGGYRRIACITGPRKVSTAMDRLAGYRSALRAGGIRYDKDLVRHADFREAGGYAAMESLLELPEPPEALFVTNNLMTVGALECLAKKGVRAPADIAVVGFDDIPWADLVVPSLTTVAQPTYELGRTAGLLLKDRIASPGRPPSTVTLRTELHIRATSAPRKPRKK
ncbi:MULTISPECIES: LacI family DNA-binding transcriptional regulator [unclassified Kribbella]|uniref:LacI family DNA-binding transcriptional regulator n=1 Tax=unclassified Kribbella TaxID=2644121 RepID=UPI0033D0C6BE